MVECKTYRHRGHFEGDPQIYKPEDEASAWLEKDPLPRYETRLLETGLLTQDKIQELDEEIKAQIQQAVKFAQASPFPAPDEITDDVYTV